MVCLPGKIITWLQNRSRRTCLSKVLNKLSKWGPDIDTKSVKAQARAPRCPFLCSKAPLDRPMVPQGAKVEAPGLSNDRLAKMTILISKVTVPQKNDMRTNIQQPAHHYTFQPKTKKTQRSRNNSPSKATQPAHHSHHHTVFISRVGAGGGRHNPYDILLEEHFHFRSC